MLRRDGKEAPQQAYQLTIRVIISYCIALYYFIFLFVDKPKTF